MPDYYAHSFGDDLSRWERLEVHLAEVADLAAQFARALDAEPWGRLAGLWHDLGKYQEAFQRRILGERIQVPHAGVGAAHAWQANAGDALPLAFAIAGHHAGLANLQDSNKGPTSLKRILAENERARTEVNASAPSNVLSAILPSLRERLQQAEPAEARRSLAFFTRMLFSALVDADRLATEAFYDRCDGKRNRTARLKYDDLPTLLGRLDRSIDRFSQMSDQRVLSAVNQLRGRVLQACRNCSANPPGLFSLTVPTGGGKTLSAMSFALRHAIAHGLRRVIVVIPFTSIIEQNAQRYRGAFGVDGQLDVRNVLEHHSGIDERRALETNAEAEICRRLAAENWDAPVIVTTTVQFFESLFSNHPSRCRKLHRIAKSVVILDEVQTLPPQFLIPIAAAMRELISDYGCSIVLSTATPPALAVREDFQQGLRGVTSIIDDVPGLFREKAAQRVAVEWRIETPLPYAELANELSAHSQVLAIVHRRQDARTLAEALPKEARFHLSALMCPAHRLKVITAVRKRLKQGRPCRLVATQLIEAGVDVDFPVVYRALAGLDSLAQSAGRCDREGKLSEAAGKPAGRFVVFRAETLPPPGTLRKAMQATEKLYRLAPSLPELNRKLDPFNPQHGEAFFRELYSNHDLDAASIQRELDALNFANVADAFKLIDDAGASIAVPWKEGAKRIADFQREASRDNLRALQPYLVQVRRPFFEHLVSIGAIEAWHDSLGLPSSLFGGRYDDDFGLSAEVSDMIAPDLLMA